MPEADGVPDHETSAAVAAGDDACPVCLVPAEGFERCRICGFELDGPVVMGALTTAAIADHEAGLARAQHAHDVGRARLAATRAGRLDLDWWSALGGLLRGGPEPAPIDDAPAGAGAASPSDQSDHASSISSAGQVSQVSTPAGAEPPGGEGLPRPGRVVCVGSDGITVHEFVPAGAGAVVERAALVRRAWPDLVPDLPWRAAEQAFLVAGGVGLDPLDPRAVDAALREAFSGPQFAGPVTALVGTAPGWRLPEHALALLAKLHTETALCDTSDKGTATAASVAVLAAGSIVIDTGAETSAAALVPAGAGQFSLLRAGTAARAAIEVWSSLDGEQTSAWDHHRARVRTLAADAAGSVVAGGDDAGAVWLWSPSSPGAPRAAAQHDAAVLMVAVSRDGAVAASLAADGWVLVVPGPAASAVPLPGGGACPGATCLALSPDGTRLAVGDAAGSVLLCALASGDEVHRWTLGAPITALCFTPDGRSLAAADRLGGLRLLPAAAAYHDPESICASGGAPITALAADAHLLAAGDEAGGVRQWSRRSGRWVLSPLSGLHDTAVLAVAVGREGVVSAGREGVARGWPRADRAGIQ